MGKAAKASIILVSFLVYYLASRYFKVIMEQVDMLVHYGLASYIFTYLLLGIPLFIGTMLIVRREGIIKSWGLNGNIFKGLLLGLAFTLSMFIGGLISYDINRDIDIPNLLAGTILAGIFEEAYFRGFLFGLLFRHTRLGYIPSAMMGAVIFATGHLHQSSDLTTQLGIFAVTFLGAGFFAWLYIEWNYNLWIPIFLHTFMNLAWMGFSVSDNAMGSLYGNIFRAVTIAAAIITTIVYKRRTGRRFEVNRETVFLIT